MLAFTDCQYAVVYFEFDETIEIVRISSTNFTEELHEKTKENLSIKIQMKTTYREEQYDTTLVQLGKTSDDLEATEERCVDLLTKKKKSIDDLLVRIPRFHVGKRMVFEPLNNIHTGDEGSSEMTKKVKKYLSQTYLSQQKQTATS